MPPEAPLPHKGKDSRPHLKRLSGWRFVVALAALAGLSVTLLAPTALLRQSDSDQGALRGLQIRVLTISQAVSENRMEGALAAVEALEEDLDDAAGQGRISLSRFRGIQAAVTSVRAEISGRIATVAAAVAPRADTADTPAAPEPLQVQQPVQIEPREPVMVPVPVPAPAPAPVQGKQVLPEPAKEAKGKGKGQGKP